MFVWVLVEVNFSRDLGYELTVEMTGVYNKIEVVYKDLPKHCSFYRLVGHTISECRKARWHAESIFPLERRGVD